MLSLGLQFYPLCSLLSFSSLHNKPHIALYLAPSINMAPLAQAAKRCYYNSRVGVA